MGLAAVCFLVAFGAVQAQDFWHAPLPHRQALDTDVQFWKKIFAEISINQYAIHDADNLARIYKIVTLDTTLSRRQQEKQLEALKEEVETLLRRFHEKDFQVSELSYWEHQVYRMFLSDQSPDKFLQASRRVRAQQGIKEKFLAGVRRSFAYLDHIEDEFKKAGLPRALIYLPHVESSFHPQARSHVGATGMWQFMRRTARQFLKVNRVKDERYDPIHSTRAAAKLLKFNYRLLQDWALAITAYNHGLGSMLKAKARYGDYLTIREKYLRRSFGFASKNFYPELLAVVEICDSLEQYAPGLEKDPPLTFQEITLPRDVNVRRLAREHQLDIETLQELNPGFVSLVWKGQMNVPANYTLRLPVLADSRAILASLGAAETDFGEVLIAANIPGSDQLRIIRMGELMQRNREIRRHLRQLRYGAYPPASSPGPERASDFLFALANPAASAAEEDASRLAGAAVDVPSGSSVAAISLPAPAEPLLTAGKDAPTPLAGPAVTEPPVPTGAEALPHSVVASGESAASLLPMPVLAAIPLKSETVVVPGRPAVAAPVPPVTPFQWQLDVPLVAAVDEEPVPQTEAPFFGGGRPDLIESREASVWQLVADASPLSYQQIMVQLKKRLAPDQNKIVIFPQETLGHYADWTGVPIQQLRRLNGIRARQNLRTGQTFRLDFSYRTPVEFLEKRFQYHTGLIQDLLKGATRMELVDHTVQPGDNLWQLAHKKYNFPVNLLLYFNDLNKLENLYPGDKIKLPIVY